MVETGQVHIIETSFRGWNNNTYRSSYYLHNRTFLSSLFKRIKSLRMLFYKSFKDYPLFIHIKTLITAKLGTEIKNIHLLLYMEITITFLMQLLESCNKKIAIPPNNIAGTHIHFLILSSMHFLSFQHVCLSIKICLSVQSKCLASVLTNAAWIFL